ncbi:MAG: hypothetical protein RL023_571 [Candidatus Parcubacteria bacterium]|jgi:hypothetical protein
MVDYKIADYNYVPVKNLAYEKVHLGDNFLSVEIHVIFENHHRYSFANI